MKQFLASAILLACAVPAQATARDTRSPLADYVRARAADAGGVTEDAAAGYGQALAATPGNVVIAARAFRQAMIAGNRPLALRAARAMEAAGAIPGDGVLLLLSEAVLQKDWVRAEAEAKRLGTEEAFGFLVPVLRAWIAYGSGKGDPLAIIDAAPRDTLAAAYSDEHRALLLLALKRKADGVAAIRALGPPGTNRDARLRIAAAARLAALGDRDEALALLEGRTPATLAARRILTARRALPGQIASAGAGIAEALTRIGADVNRERVSPIAVSFGRIATDLAPENAETWLVLTSLLASGGQPAAALAALGHVAPDDPFAEEVRDMRVELLLRRDQQQAALAEALAAATAQDAAAADWSRVGDLYGRLDRQREAAAAYERALAMSSGVPERDRWSLYLLRGGALEQAGDWAAAKESLAKAAALAPEQAVALNYLGYAQLERRENLAEAEKLIERASTLRPDDPSITDSLGWTYFIRGDVPKAIRTLERAAVGDPAEPTINEHLGDAYWTAGRRMEARFAWRAALLTAANDDATRIRTKIDTGLTPAVAAP
jgi:tetratricopeptide (TPR) repeat protein